jgi:hypothetical protein
MSASVVATISAGIGLAAAGATLICLNLRSARRSGPQSGVAGLVRAFASWIAVLTGGTLLALGLLLSASPFAAPF